MLTKITLRPANMDDMVRIFHWRNEETIRKWSLVSSKIDWETHQNWFTKSLLEPNRSLLVAMDANQALGVVRLDREHDTVEISVYLSPEYIGKGLGESLVRVSQNWIKTHLLGVKKIRAKVLLDNIASQKVFTRSGFVEHDRWLEQNQEKGIIYYYELYEENGA